jgi:PKD repeat protein
VQTNISGYSRPPHHSPQYNMLIGIVQDGYISTNVFGAPTNIVGNHGRWDRNPNQCASCHVPSYSLSSATNVTGHTFAVDNKGCNLAGCHLSGIPDTHGWMQANEHRVESVVDLLRSWATNKGPAILGANYTKHKENSWEFTTVGELATATNAGPSSSDQLKLPEAIRQARFNLYMVAHDGSWGVHNTRFTPLLIRDAESKVLNQLSVAKFNVANPFVFTNVNVTFTNLNPGVTACTWDYGDGTSNGTSTAATHTHAYATAGTYTVKLTATDVTGTETLVRTNLIVVYNKPSVSFTMTPSTGTAPLTVTFNNTSTDATYYRWSFAANVNSSLYSNEENPTFTYTNAGTYHVALRGYNEGGNVTITNTLIVTP